MKKIYSLFLSFFIVLFWNAILHANTWEKTFGGPQWESGSSIQQTADGGYIIVGSTGPRIISSETNTDVYLIKTDVHGVEEWSKTFGGSGLDMGSSCQQTTDGGYIIAGTTKSIGAYSDVYLIKTNALGEEEWSKTFGGSSSDMGSSCQQTNDGGYIITGSTRYEANDYVYLIKTDSQGEEEWSKTLGGSWWDYGSSVKQTTDGGYIITGETFGSFIDEKGCYDVYQIPLIKTDSQGVEEWSKTFAIDDCSWNTGYTVQQTDDGGYVIIGGTGSFEAGNDDVYLIKTNALGEEEWSKTFGGSSSDMGKSGQQTTDGGYIIAGTTQYLGTENGDVYLIYYNPIQTYPNDPPSTPTLSLPSNGESGIDPSNIVLEWNPSTDPDGDSIEYCVTINEDGDPDDIPVFTGCDDEIFTSDTSINLNYDYSIQLEAGKTYWWAVWAKDSQGNWSEASEWWSFATAEFIFLEDLNSLFPGSWYDGREIYQHNRESIFSIIQNCLSDPSYTYSEGDNIYVPLKTNEYIRNNYSLDNLPIAHILNEDSSITSCITPWLDASWDNLIDSYTDPRNKFNTVYRGNPQANKKFEVISRIDEGNTPFDGTDNVRSYFFTYDTKTDLNGVATTLDEWINYLAAIVVEYGRPIDILTIFAHGFPGEIQMSEAFHFKSDTETQRGMERLRNEGILAPCGTILLFSCEVGQNKEFVQNLANWSNATVYANSVSTGKYTEKRMIDGSYVVTKDWDLDVVKVPDNFIPCEDTLEAPLRANDDITFMFPGGIAVEIAEDTLNNDGIMIITNTLNNLEELGIDTEGMIFLAAYDILLEGTVIKDQAYITVTFPYSSDIGDISASDINIKYWDEELQEWSDAGITDVLVNEEDHFVTFKTSHATVFAVLIENQPPTADAGPDQTVPVGFDCTATVTLNGSASNDPDQDQLTYIWTWDTGTASVMNPDVPLELGSHTITLIVNDGLVDSEPDFVEITLVDTTPPELNVSVSPDTLCPPNHKMVLVTPTIIATDNCDPNPQFELTSITMDEAEVANTFDPNYDSNVGDGNTSDDIQVDESGKIYLRAERSGTGDGRVYTITYTATDSSGNKTNASATVTVPHNQ